VIRESEKDPDREIIGEVLRGNRESFAALVKKYQSRIFSLGLRFFRNRDDAGDFAQEVFVKAFQRLGSFRGESLFATWLMKVAYYHGISGKRAKKETGSLPEDFDFPDTRETPERLHLRRAAGEALKEALKLLPERYRICIDLYFSFGMSYDDIALTTDIPAGTVKSHIFRAKQALRIALKNSSAEDYDYGM
jgi:RNA polymerase sigma-70 factor (ECF subfamily)